MTFSLEELLEEDRPRFTVRDLRDEGEEERRSRFSVSELMESDEASGDEDYGFTDVLRGRVQEAGARLDRAIAGGLGGAKRVLDPIVGETEGSVITPIVKHLEERAETLEREAAKVPPRNLGETISGAVAGAPIDVLNVLGVSKLAGVPSWLRWPFGIGASEFMESLSRGEEPMEAAKGGAKYGISAAAIPAVAPLPVWMRAPLLAAVGGKVATSEGQDPAAASALFGLAGLARVRERGARLREPAPRTSALETGRISTQEIDASAKMGISARKTVEAKLTADERMALREMDAKIGPTAVEREYAIGDSIRQAGVDDLHHAARFERAIEGTNFPDGVYETARRLRGVPNIAEGLVRWGAPKWEADGSLSWTGKSYQDIFRPVAGDRRTLKAFQRYMVGRRAQELRGQKRELLFTEREIAASLKLRNPVFEQAFNDLVQFKKNIADFAQGAGLLNSEQRAAWRSSEYALAFFRERAGRRGIGKGSALGGEEATRTLRGSVRNLRDPMENIIEGDARLIQLALENQARMKIADMAAKPGGEKFLKSVSSKAKEIKFGRDNLEAQIRRAAKTALKDADETFTDETLDRIVKVPNMLEIISLYQGGYKPFGENIMTVFRNGKPSYYEVADSGLQRSLEAFRRPALTGVRRFWNGIRRMSQSSITLDPTFMYRNASRDTAMSTIMTRTGFQHLTEVVRAYKDTIFKTEAYRDFVLHGGGGASFYDGGDSLRRMLVKHAQRTGFNPKGLIVTPMDAIRLVERIGRIIEEVPRVAEFKRGVRKGMTKTHSAYLGREITTDFSVQGDRLRFLSHTIPFFNAMVAGGDRLYRSVVRDPTKKAATAAKMAMVPLFGAALHLINMERESYRDLPDWDKWTNWHFYFDNEDGIEEHYKQPKLWEIGGMSSITERALDSMIGGADPDASLGWDLAKIIGMNFSIGLPVGLHQLYEQGTNRRTFTGAAIETEGMQNMSPYLRSRPETSTTLKELSMLQRNLPKGAQASPVRAEALYRGLFNSWAVYSLDLLDRAIFPDKTPALHADDKVIMRAIKERKGKYNRYISKFYDLAESTRQAQGDIDELYESRRPEIAREELADPETRLLDSMAKQMRRSNKVVQEYNRDMDAIAENPHLSREQKRDMREKLRLQRDEYMKSVVQSYHRDLRKARR